MTGLRGARHHARRAEVRDEPLRVEQRRAGEGEDGGRGAEAAHHDAGARRARPDGAHHVVAAARGDGDARGEAEALRRGRDEAAGDGAGGDDRRQLLREPRRGARHRVVVVATRARVEVPRARRVARLGEEVVAEAGVDEVVGEDHVTRAGPHVGLALRHVPQLRRGEAGGDAAPELPRRAPPLPPTWRCRTTASPRARPRTARRGARRRAAGRTRRCRGSRRGARGRRRPPRRPRATSPAAARRGPGGAPRSGRRAPGSARPRRPSPGRRPAPSCSGSRRRGRGRARRTPPRAPIEVFDEQLVEALVAEPLRADRGGVDVAVAQGRRVLGPVAPGDVDERRPVASRRPFTSGSASKALARSWSSS